MLRTFDKQGRISIPKIILSYLNAKPNQRFEILMRYGVICIKKFDEKNVKELPYLGIVRALDNVNRIVIPKEYYEFLESANELNVELSKDGETILITKA